MILLKKGMFFRENKVKEKEKNNAFFGMKIAFDTAEKEEEEYRVRD